MNGLTYGCVPHRLAPALVTGVAAGVVGGAAEIAWVLLYAEMSGTSAAAVAAGVTATIFPGLGAAGIAMPLGVALHMALAVALGVAIAGLLRSLAPRLAGTVLEPLAVIGLLAAIWAVNFLVVLPAINPGFAALVPPLAGLASKLSFGAAAALVMYCRDPRGAKPQ